MREPVQALLFAAPAIAAQHPAGLAPGTEVGARRWPCAMNHPDGWGMPWRGEVLTLDDPRAWAGSIAFGHVPEGQMPDRAAVTAHVARCLEQGLLQDRLPVLWDFGPHEARVYFEQKASLRPYAEDMAAWTEERARAYGEYRTTAAQAA